MKETLSMGKYHLTAHLTPAAGDTRARQLPEKAKAVIQTGCWLRPAPQSVYGVKWLPKGSIISVLKHVWHTEQDLTDLWYLTEDEGLSGYVNQRETVRNEEELREWLQRNHSPVPVSDCL